MKPDIHPEYRDVIFQDAAAGVTTKLPSAVKTRETIVWDDGQEYPLVKLSISSASHPFYTGQQRFVDTAGRIEKFQARYAKAGTVKGKKKAKADDKS